MNKLLLISILFFSWVLQAAEQKKSILLCLGKSEEKIYRQKEIGPVYMLTQHFINEFSSAPGLKLKSQYLHEICSTRKDFAPSVILLKLLLMHGESIFEERKRDSQNYDVIAFDAIMSEVPSVFFRYLGALQSLTQSPTCLNDHIPNYKYFVERFQYLEGEFSPAEFFIKERAKVDGIFNSLRSFDKIVSLCEKERKVLDEKRKKEMEKSNGPEVSANPKGRGIGIGRSSGRSTSPSFDEMEDAGSYDDGSSNNFSPSAAPPVNNYPSPVFNGGDESFSPPEDLID